METNQHTLTVSLRGTPMSDDGSEIKMTQKPAGKEVKVIIRKQPRCLVCKEPVLDQGRHGLCVQCIDRFSAHSGECV